MEDIKLQEQFKKNKQEFFEQHKYMTVIRSVSLPLWLDRKAREKKVSVSKVLQKALIELLCNGEEPE